MLNCLIVEDNPLNLRIMQSQAHKLGLNVHICTNGVEALNFCRTNPMPPLIILDGSMPEMDGVTFLHHMRALPQGDIPYVVFCSASLERHEVAEALDVGAECHLPKPITRDQLTYAVKQAQNRMQRRHLSGQLVIAPSA